MNINYPVYLCIYVPNFVYIIYVHCVLFMFTLISTRHLLILYIIINVIHSYTITRLLNP